MISLRSLLLILLVSTATAQILSVPHGGTGNAELTHHGPLVGNGTGPVTALDPGTAGQCLISGGPNVDPVFAACPAGSGPGGGITSINGSSVATQTLQQGTGIAVSTNIGTGVTTISNTLSVPTSANWPNAGNCTTGQYVNALINGSAPTCTQILYSQISGTPTIPTSTNWPNAGSCTNQYVSALSNGAAPTCTTWPTFNQSTTGNAATATALSSSGTANQVWGMNAGGTAQGWQTPSGGPGGGGGPLSLVYSTPTSNISVTNGTLGNVLQTITLVTPTSATYYRLETMLKQTNPSGGSAAACSAWPSVGLRLSYTDADMGTVPIGNQGGIQLYHVNGGAVVTYGPMNAGSGPPGQGNAWTGIPTTFYAQGGQPVTLTVWQQAPATCTVYPIVMVRPLLYQLNVP